ncbi:MAG: hypothetical protein AB7N80_01430 [Bdellovibrionales bacterium]
MEASSDFWRKCSTCKKNIGFNQKYYVCSVSTCNGQRTGYVFCSVVCCEAHVPGARHRDSSAIEMMSPKTATTAVAASSPATTPQPQRKIIAGSGSTSGTNFGGAKNQFPHDILIVASKLKDYIKARADMNTSGNVMEVLSDLVRRHCDDAIDKARQEGRKTVMDRDFKKWS